MNVRLITICAACDFPATLHTNDDDSVYVMADGFKVYCPRSWDTIGSATWSDKYGREFSDYQIDRIALSNRYYAHLVPDVTGSEAQSGSDLMLHRDATIDRDLFGIGADDLSDPNQNPDLLELEKLDRWNDATYSVTASSKSWTCTSVLGEEEGEYILRENVSDKNVKSRSKTFLPTSDSVSTETRNAYVEGNEGFLSLKLLDETLTRKYHAKLLNVFLDKATGDVRIGSIRILKNTDGTITARCVNASCSGTFGGPRASMTINLELADRQDMESFVLAIVGHGNNHAASWFKNRESYYKIHKPNCQIGKACHPTDGICTSPVVPAPAPNEDSELNEVEFLMEHQQYCRDSKCQCDQRLAELVPALAENTHATSSAA